MFGIKKTANKTVKKKLAFGGYSINFSRVHHMTVGQVFGSEDLAPSEMTKRLWKFVKKHELSKKG